MLLLEGKSEKYGVFIDEKNIPRETLITGN